MVFLGDFIDAGEQVATPDDEAVLRRVRELMEGGHASAVMGNHELNAILFHRVDDLGCPLRPRNDKNRAQHRSFCDRFGIGTKEALEWTAWFLKLPLWIDLGGLRLVHAFWCPTSIRTIAERRADGRLLECDLEEVARKETAFARAVDLLLSGPEIPLPTGVEFRDNSGNFRQHVRLAWWRSHAATWRTAALSVPVPEELPDTPIPRGSEVGRLEKTNSPVLVGHYKMTGRPQIESCSAACLDYPKSPCVYLWQGEKRLKSANLKLV